MSGDDPTRPDGLASTAPDVTSALAPGARGALGDRPAPPAWDPGAVILDRYRVIGVLGEGGMGQVVRVRHTEWAVDLAVKTPLWRHVLRMGGIDDFVREAETWVGLGGHPHVVTCYFVRRIDGLPRVFAEYVAGGSLADWLADGRLREGGPARHLARALDVAIQMVWALDHAHRHGLVHRDVKPANVMMTPGGAAKLTDFGLAQARDGGDGPVAGGCTPRYAAPEQLEGRAAGPATDVYAFGATLAEMLIGEATWPLGSAAGVAWEGWLRGGGAGAVPASIGALVAECLAPNPADRPPDLTALAERLRRAFRLVTGLPHPRRAPAATAARADGLNNRAVSLLELGRAEAAAALLDEALAVDRHHLLATYNRALLGWRRGALADLACLAAVAEAGRSSDEPGLARLLVGWLHAERGDADAAREALRLAAAQLEPSAQPELARARAAVLPGWRAEGRWALPFGAAAAVACDAAGVRACCAAGLDVYALDGDVFEPRGGHGNLVAALAFAPDGALLSAGHDRALRRHDAGADGGVRAESIAPLWALAVGDAGALVGGRAGVALFVTADGARPLEGHPSDVLAVALTPDGLTGVTADASGALRAWALPAPALTASTAGRGAAVHALALAPDGRWALAGAWDGALLRWQLGHAPTVIGRHEAPVTALRLTADARFAVSGDAGGEILVWRADTGRVLRRFGAHQGEVVDLAISADAAVVWSVGADATLRRFRLDLRPRPAPHLVVRPAPTEDLVAHQAHFESALQAAHAALRVDDLGAATAAVERARGLPGYGRAPEAVDAWRAVVARRGRGALADIWGEVVGATEAPAARVAVDGDRRACGRWDGVVLLDDQPVAAHAEAVLALAFREGALWSTAADGGLRCDGRTLDPLPSAGEALAAGVDAVFVGCADGRVYHLDPASGRVRAAWSAHPGGVAAVAWRDDRLWSAGRDGVRTWDAAGARVARVATGAPVTALAAGACGALLGDVAGAVHLWRPDGSLARLGTHADATLALALSGDGRTAVSVGADGALHVWDVAAERLLRAVPVDDDAVPTVAMAPDASSVFTGGRRVVRWTLDWRLA